MYRKLGIVAVSLLLVPSAAPAEGYRGFGRDSLSEEVLEKYAPPPIDGGLKRKIESYLDIRAPGAGVLSPDRRTLFFNWDVTGTRQVWRVDGPLGFPVQLTGGEDSSRLLDVTPDGEHLVLSRDSQGDEMFGIYLQSTSGGGLKTVFKAPKVRASYAFVSDDSRWVYYVANDARPDGYVVYRHDTRTGKREVVFDREGLWFVSDHRPDGRLLLVKLKGNVYREYHEWDPARRALTPVIGQGEMEEYSVSYGARDGEFIVRTNKLGEYRRLYRYRAGQLTPVTPEMPHDVSSFSVDRRRKRILYGINREGYSRLAAMDARTFEPVDLPEFPDADHVRFGRTTRDARHTIIEVETSKAPDSSYVYDWRTRKLTRWVVPSTPEIDTRRFAQAELEHYPARDGTRIPMFVWRPDECRERSCPVIVRFHGGPEGQARPGFSPRVQLFLDEGFVFVQPNVRGSNGYGKSWLHADNGPRRLDVITDIEDCALHIRKAWTRDGRAPKIGIYGGSYGGYSTLVGMTLFAGAYDAGVAAVGMSSLVTFLENTAPYRRLLRVTEYGDPEGDREALLRLSPITHVAKVEDPVLILHGATDPRVPVGEAIQFYDEVRKRSVPAGLVIFADEGHGVRKRPNRVLSLGHTIGFFKTHLQ